jgi:hypothetical protein
MAIKVTAEEKQQIQQTYLKYRNKGLSKTEARRRTAKDCDRGLTTVWDSCVGTDYAVVEPKVTSAKISAEWPKSYIITSWEIRVRPNRKFIACLEQMAKAYDAELILVPCNESDINYLPDVLKDKFNVVTDTFKLNENLQLRYVETSALLQSPLSGHTGAYSEVTTILPGLVKELRTEPSQHYVKQLISTGSVGYLDARGKDYGDVEGDKDFNKRWRTVASRRNGKTTAIAENYVEPSALIVDVLDRKTFLTRFVSSKKPGVVYDLNNRFTPEGYEKCQPSALVIGDSHAYEIDEDAYRATKEMIRVFNPKEVVLNDFFSGVSINHHEMMDAVKMHNQPSLREEADVTITMLKELSRISNKLIYLQSNHDNFLTTFLNMNDRMWRLNRNYELACGLQFYRANTQQHPIVKLLELNKFDNLEFVTEKDNHYVGKVLVKHGHEGQLGGRTGFQTLARTYNYYVQGHTHTPAVFRNAMCVGLTAKLDLEYNIGASNWLHANGLIHEDGSSQLLPIIYGQWIR